MKYTTILLLLAYQVVSSQSVSGTIFDIITGEALVGASVYLDGTSTGTITDQNGYFIMQSDFNSNTNLIISYIGYKTHSLGSSGFQKDLEIGLEEDVFSVPGVIIVSDPFSRRQKLAAFRLEFLGESKAAKECIIENEDDIELYFDSKDNTLNAYAQTPIIVKNKFLGYNLKFDLIDFKIKFREKSLERTDNLKFTIIHGFSLFEETSLAKDYFPERRANTYLGSVQHFIKTMWSQNWKDEDFEIRKRGKKVYPADVFNISTGKDLFSKSVSLKREKVFIKHKKGVFSYRSTLEVSNGNSFTIDPYGNYGPYNKVKFGGYMGTFRIANLLPSDYELTKPLE